MAAALALAGCGDRGRPVPAPAPSAPPPREWTAEEIAGDPAGYMKWADREVVRQIADREQRQVRINARLSETQLKQRQFAENLSEISNLNQRMRQAVQRAEDEDRWPLVLGGESFAQARAKAVIEQTRRYVEDRSPMSTAYGQAVAKLEDASRTLARDIEQLRRLREKLALDLERIRLSQGVDELAELRKTETEIAGFSRALAQMADEAALTASALPSGAGAAPVDVSAFLKKR